MEYFDIDDDNVDFTVGIGDAANTRTSGGNIRFKTYTNLDRSELNGSCIKFEVSVGPLGLIGMLEFDES